MKKRTFTHYLLALCLGLLLSTGGLFDSQIAFCQPEEEEEEPIQARPAPDLRQNPLDKQRVMNPAGRMRTNPVQNRQGTVADDGEHGDGRQPAMQPVVPAKRLTPRSPAH